MPITPLLTFLLPILAWALIFLCSFFILTTTLIVTRNMDIGRRRRIRRTVLDLTNYCQHLRRRLEEVRDGAQEVRDAEYDGDEDEEGDGVEVELEEGQEDQEEEDGVMISAPEDQFEELGREELEEEEVGLQEGGEEEEEEEDENENDEDDNDWDALSDSHSDVTTSSLSTDSSSSGSELSSQVGSVRIRGLT